ncbi:hypothetical protein BDZ89DRAFT_1042918 [Hymenopellis radicata]|nr:hypothetical protein BDZ89DRAFT_1042918 [Hymenopellis radicata]
MDESMTGPSVKSTSRQIVSRDESHVLSREATGEDGRRVTSRAANGRRSTHVSIETRFSSGRRRAGRGVEADEDPSQVELNAVLRGKSRWRSTVQSESDLNQRLRSEVKSTSRQIVSRDESHVLSREATGEDGRRVTSRTVPAPRWLGLGGDGEG